MLKPIKAFLWRKCEKATLDTLNGISAGQYHIALSTEDFNDFFDGLPRINLTEKGGFDIKVPLQPFTGTDPIGAAEITVRYMGPKSARKDWNIPAQRPETAYELWRKGRGFLPESSDFSDYIVIARDIDNCFHARWIRSADFNALPSIMKQAIQKNHTGWYQL